jgi:Zn-dependent protease with chaperone function
LIASTSIVTTSAETIFFECEVFEFMFGGRVWGRGWGVAKLLIRQGQKQLFCRKYLLARTVSELYLPQQTKKESQVRGLPSKPPLGQFNLQPHSPQY